MKAKEKERKAQYYIDKIKKDPVRYARHKARNRDYHRRRKTLMQNMMDNLAS